MSYLYEVGYTSYEESPGILLQHHEQLSDEEFRQLCVNVTMDLYRQDPMQDRFDVLYNKVAAALVEHYGFQYVPVKRFIPWGWSRFVGRDDWDYMTEDDEDFQALHKAAKNALSRS